MSDSEIPERIRAVFESLQSWRRLPSYQLERRADIFFSVYLKGFLEKELGVDLDDMIIPELPLRQESSNRSNKVDYALFTPAGSSVRTMYLIELKTDPNLRNKKQCQYLEVAASQYRVSGIKGIQEHIMKIWGGSDSAGKRKYAILMDMMKKVDQGIRNVEVVVLQPTATDHQQCKHCGNFLPPLTFEKFVVYLRSHSLSASDPFAGYFADQVELWDQVLA